MREIIVDTETTGLDPNTGHRLVEIACVEMFNLVPTGKTYHSYIDPQRDVPEDAFRIHGLSTDFLVGKPPFEVAHIDFLAFIGAARLIIHNAEFDIKFINAELKRVGQSPLLMTRVFDTLAFARKKHPGASNSLDALCMRYRIDNTKRVKHGALLDAEILAEVYVELMGGRQTSLTLAAEIKTIVRDAATPIAERPAPLPCRVDAQDWRAHAAFRQTIGPDALWSKYIPAAVTP